MQTFRLSDDDEDEGRDHDGGDDHVVEVDVTAPIPRLTDFESEIRAGLRLNAIRRRKLQDDRVRVIRACLDNDLPPTNR